MTPTQTTARLLLEEKLKEVLSTDLMACCMDDEEDRALALEVLMETSMEWALSLIQATLILTHESWFGKGDTE
jgi:hypothetical protein